MTEVKSGSEAVLEYLKKLAPDDEFSRVSIYIGLKENVSEGAIGGFLSRLKANGNIKIARTTRQTHNGRLLEHYNVVDLGNVAVKATPKIEHRAQRTGGKGTTNRQRLIDMLFTIASEIENMSVSLSDYSTKELLKEIEKRTTQIGEP